MSIEQIDKWINKFSKEIFATSKEISSIESIKFSSTKLVYISEKELTQHYLAYKNLKSRHEFLIQKVNDLNLKIYELNEKKKSLENRGVVKSSQKAEKEA